MVSNVKKVFPKIWFDTQIFPILQPFFPIVYWLETPRDNFIYMYKVCQNIHMIQHHNHQFKNFFYVVYLNKNI